MANNGSYNKCILLEYTVLFALGFFLCRLSTPNRRNFVLYFDRLTPKITYSFATTIGPISSRIDGMLLYSCNHVRLLNAYILHRPGNRVLCPA